MTFNKTICLNMIVKDESAVIRRGLNSIKRLIDYWVIVDTGSTDGTQAIVQETLKGIPGELHERPWKNFAHNRNEALELARGKADYIFFTDADEEIKFCGSLDKSELDQDYYFILMKKKDIEYYRILLIKDRPGWVWRGILHEYIANDQPLQGQTLTEIFSDGSNPDGHRSLDPDQYLKDARILEQELKKDPRNTRILYFLAQSYRNAQQPIKALHYYAKRAAMDVEMKEEVFWSLYLIGCIQQELKMAPDLFIKSYCSAYAYNQTRAEPLYRLANHYNRTGHFILAYSIAKTALIIPKPTFYMCLEPAVYDYGILFELANSAHSLGKRDIARQLYRDLLIKETLPASYREIIHKNLQ